MPKSCQPRTGVYEVCEGLPIVFSVLDCGLRPPLELTVVFDDDSSIKWLSVRAKSRTRTLVVLSFDMKNTLLIVLLVVLVGACTKEAPKEPPKLEEANYEQLQRVFKKDDNVLYLVNFWATWCKPCVQELPEFIEVNNTLINNKKFKMVLVSLDRSDQLNAGVKAMVQSKNITADVYLLNDPTRMDEWINATNPEWSGAIPATALYKNKKQVYFHEGQLSKPELEQIIREHI